MEENLPWSQCLFLREGKIGKGRLNNLLCAFNSCVLRCRLKEINSEKNETREKKKKAHCN